MGAFHTRKSVPVIFLSIFLPFIAVADICILILLPEKLSTGFDQLKLTLHLLNSSAPVAHAISLLLPKVNSESTEAKIG